MDKTTFITWIEANTNFKRVQADNDTHWISKSTRLLSEKLKLEEHEVIFTWENDRQGDSTTVHNTYSFDTFIGKYEEYSLYDN